jgi:hypothetical protein
MYVVLGVLAVFVALIALAWFVVLRRMDEGNFEAGRRLHPPWVPRKALPVGHDLADERAPDRAWSESRQLEREEHAGASKGMEDAKDRNVGRSWVG